MSHDASAIDGEERLAHWSGGTRTAFMHCMKIPLAWCCAICRGVLR